ncbi:hypothetical protein BPOR_0147g00110 [Botrytis porri]|uniref:Uncharacterized protein n=2 Tax=Botrytis porri TaxID=87229 RepID=A0A4Z1KVW9_9HELO|nr:hypothetical protein BPOR_0147g00110 [Botrytis porri]
MAKRISHFEALDLARVERGEMNGDGDGNGDGDRKRKSTQRWTWDLEKENAEAEAKEEEENEWVTKGEMAKGWVCEGEEKGEESRRRVAVESGWLHFVGRDEDGEGNGEGNGGEEKKKEKEGWSEIRMEKEIDA